jgi:diguanylate cyclase (GGDEF)-like protein
VLALNEGKVDIVANYYSLGANNYVNSNKFRLREYVVLTHADNPLTIETLSTLSNSTIEMLGRMNLTSLMKSKGLFKVKEYSNSKELFKNINKESIIIVEKEFYEYYKNSKLKNYVIKYNNSQDINNSFLLNNNNNALNRLFNFYLTLNSDNEMLSRATQKLYVDARSNVLLSFIWRNILYIVLILAASIFVIYKLAHRIRISKRIKKEDKLLYIDVLTNLKNRNYLNDNIKYWSENKVYPQAILILDLNQIKDLNDKYGHEEGDKQIQAAANALIKTQRENSEIMRTDGNEFMVYLVGYEEKIVLSYIHKLTRELNSTLPYSNYGIALGYAMIENELNTIDDAINDASNRMRANKGETSEK